MNMPDRITDEVIDSPWEGDENRVDDVVAWLEVKLARNELDSSAVSDAWDVLEDAFIDHGGKLLRLLFLSDREQASEYGRGVAIELLNTYVAENINVLSAQRTKEQQIY